MRVATIFSGIDVPHLSFAEAGCEVVFCAEIEPFPCHVLHQRFGASRPMHMPDPAAPDLIHDEHSARRAAIRAVSKIPEHGVIPNLGDVTQVDWDAVVARYGPIDCLVFGSPCQDFSVAGERLGLDAPRGNLALIAIAVARRLNASWIVFENVPGLLSITSDDGPPEGEAPDDLVEGEEREVVEEYDCDRDSGFWLFLTTLSECGFGWAYRILDAQWFGLAQRRSRVFLVGHLGDWAGPAAVLFERESLRGDNPPSRSAWQGPAAGALGSAQGGSDDNDARAHHLVAGTLTSNGKAAGSATQQDAENGMLVTAYGGNNTAGPIEVATAVNAHGGPHGRLDFESETFVTTPVWVPDLADPLCANEQRTYTHEGENNFRTRNVIAFDTTQITHPENRSSPKARDPAPTLSREGHAPAVAYQCHGSNVGPMGTLRAGHNETRGVPFVAHEVIGFRAAGQDGFTPSDVAPPIAASQGGGAGAPTIAFSCKDDGRDCSIDISPTLRSMNEQHGNPNAGGQVAITTNYLPQSSRVYDANDVGPTLQSTGNNDGTRVPAIAFKPAHYTRDKDGAPSDLVPTLQKETDRGDMDAVICAPSHSPTMRVRRLMPPECERLQGVPDDFTLITINGKPAKDGPRYKALGNTMPKPVLDYIAKRLVEVDKIINKGNKNAAGTSGGETTDPPIPAAARS